jgi:hypothetical protein
MFLKFSGRFLWNKFNIKFLLASVKKNPSSKTFFKELFEVRRKPPVPLKIAPKAACDPEICSESYPRS